MSDFSELEKNAANEQCQTVTVPVILLLAEFLCRKQILEVGGSTCVLTTTPHAVTDGSDCVFVSLSSPSFSAGEKLRCKQSRPLKAVPVIRNAQCLLAAPRW